MSEIEFGNPIPVDYEKKYKESVEKLRYKISDNNGNIDYKAVVNAEELQDIFSELAESENEKIRKSIIEHLQSDIDDMSKSDCPFDFEAEIEELSKYIAWLEKQVPKWSEEDEHHWMMCLECVEECATQEREDFSKTIDWLKSIKKSNGGINYDR